MKYLQLMFENNTIYSILSKNDKIYRKLYRRYIQRKIKDDIKDIRENHTNGSGIWNLKGIEKETIEYYKKTLVGNIAMKLY